MGRPAKVPRLTNIVKIKKPKNTPNETDKLRVLKMYHVEGFSMTDIGNHLGFCRQTVSKIITTCELTQEDEDTLVYNPNYVKDRIKLDTFERAKLLADDAMQTVEYTMSIMKWKLQQDILLAETEKKGPSTTMAELTKFLAAAAPYVLPKKVQGSTKLPADKATPSGKLHKLMSSNNKTA